MDCGGSLMASDFLNLATAFAVGVASSIAAESLILYFTSNTLLMKAIALIGHRKSLARLRDLRNRIAPHADNPHAIIRADWACALYDLESPDQEVVRKTLNVLYHVADLLDAMEKDIAYEALRRALPANSWRDLDKHYLETM